jgi:hypothetical protein
MKEPKVKTTNQKKQWRLSMLSSNGKVLEQMDSSSHFFIDAVLKNDEGYWSDVRVELKSEDGKRWADVTDWMKEMNNWRKF